MYAGRKRRKPAQRGVKPTPVEGAKSNPSKRHRDRLNSELDRLAGLLPFSEDVVSSLDKLSILRLSVSFLRTKGFFSVALKGQRPEGGDRHRDSKTSGSADGGVPEGELLLQALNGFVLVVTGEGVVFFCSHTIQDYLGFHQTDVMHQSVFELIHTEDQQEFRRNLHWALNPPTGGDSPPSTSHPTSYDPDQLPPENSSFLERGFVCRFRCLLDNSSGFLAMNLQGRLKFLHGQSQPQCQGEGNASPQLAMFAIATPLQLPAILEIRTRNMIFRTKHKLDFTPMACDAKGKMVLGYTEAELRVRGSGYQFIHAADMLHCAENHVRMMKTGESGLTVFRLLTKDNRWKWVQANARLVYKNSRPDYIIATQRPLAEEEGGEHLRKRSMDLPFTFATGEALLYQTSYPMHGFPDSGPGKAKGSKAKKGKLDKSGTEDLDPKSLLGALMSQDESVYVCHPDSEPKMSYHSSLFGEQQGPSGGFDGLIGGDSWRDTTNREMVSCKRTTSSFDPLLATLDSLSLEEDETCSNSELFSALENLGLNAEDLELLLLDERMIQVELEPNHIPTLSDLLTNNEILSYIHNSLESGADVREPEDRVGFGPPDSSKSLTHQLHSSLASAVPQTHPDIRQMLPLSQLGSAANNVLTGTPNGGHLMGMMENHYHSNTHTHYHSQTVLKSSQVNGEHRQLNPLLGSSQHWQQDQLSLQPQLHLPLKQMGSEGDLKLLFPSYQDQLNLTTNGAYIPNGLATFQQNMEVDYSIPSRLNGGSTAVNGADICYQRLLTSTQPYEQNQNLPPTQGSVPELDPVLALTQSQHILPSLEAYSVFNASTTQDATHSKLATGRLLSAANTAYIRSCLMPGGTGTGTGNVPVSHPDTLPALQDPPKSGFFI
ncbi:aryl hydrocarbon receptor 1b [Genypterus blacodes]|uniref:aryl hydrocarbon receptor 1b n=1 Tax=Genypterus blacodes TaxID=154954 RepID=UPI003F75C0AC